MCSLFGSGAVCKECDWVEGNEASLLPRARLLPGLHQVMLLSCNSLLMTTLFVHSLFALLWLCAGDSTLWSFTAFHSHSVGSWCECNTVTLLNLRMFQQKQPHYWALKPANCRINLEFKCCSVLQPIDCHVSQVWGEEEAHLHKRDPGPHWKAGVLLLLSAFWGRLPARLETQETRRQEGWNPEILSFSCLKDRFTIFQVCLITIVWSRIIGSCWCSNWPLIMHFKWKWRGTKSAVIYSSVKKCIQRFIWS